MFLSEILNEAFRSMEAHDVVVAQLRASADTLCKLRKELPRNIMDYSTLWTARLVVDNEIPYGEVELSPDDPDAQDTHFGSNLGEWESADGSY